MIRSMFHKLDGQTVVPCTSEEWHDWFIANEGTTMVKRTLVGDKTVSTIFDGCGPNLFETAVWTGDEVPDVQRRYSTWDDAIKGHDALVAELAVSET